MNTPLLLPEHQAKESYSPLSASVLERIESDHVAPTPRWQFLFSEYGVWTLWGISILLGALASAVTIFILTHAGLGMYEATHDTVYDLFLNVLPGMWVIVFALMALIAHYNLRRTKHGYRYAVWQILVSSILFSLAGGMILTVIGVGFFIDDFIGREAPPLFPSLNRTESHIWQAPTQGRMIASYVGEGPSANLVYIADNSGAQWLLDTRELDPNDLQNLYSGGQVHIIGIASSTNDSYFYGCDVLPWNPSRNMNFSDIMRERELFIERMENHEKAMLQSMLATGSLTSLPLHPLCARHSAVIRVQREFVQ